MATTKIVKIKVEADTEDMKKLEKSMKAFDQQISDQEAHIERYNRMKKQSMDYDTKGKQFLYEGKPVSDKNASGILSGNLGKSFAARMDIAKESGSGILGQVGSAIGGTAKAGAAAAGGMASGAIGGLLSSVVTILTKIAAPIALIVILMEAAKHVMKIVGLISNVLSMIAMPFLNLLIPPLLMILTFLTPFIRVANVLMRPLYIAMMESFKILKPFIQAVSAAIAGGDIGAALGNLGGILATALAPIIDVLPGVLASMLPVLVSAITMIMTGGIIPMLAAFLPPLLSALGSFLSEVGPKIVPFITTTLTTLWDSLKTTVSGVLSTLGDIVKGILNGLLGGNLATIVNGVRDFLLAVGGGFFDLRGSIITIASDIWTKFVALVTDVWGFLSGTVLPLLEKFMTPILDMVSKFVSAVLTAFAELKFNVLSAVTNIVAAIKLWTDPLNQTKTQDEQSREIGRLRGDRAKEISSASEFKIDTTGIFKAVSDGGDKLVAALATAIDFPTMTKNNDDARILYDATINKMAAFFTEANKAVDTNTSAVKENTLSAAGKKTESTSPVVYGPQVSEADKKAAWINSKSMAYTGSNGGGGVALATAASMGNLASTSKDANGINTSKGMYEQFSSEYDKMCSVQKTAADSTTQYSSALSASSTTAASAYSTSASAADNASLAHGMLSTNTDLTTAAATKLATSLTDPLNVQLKIFTENLDPKLSIAISRANAAVTTFIEDLVNKANEYAQMIKDAADSGDSGSGGSGGDHNDFISRPGSPPAKFSPEDTIIGVKDPSALNGGGKGLSIVIGDIQIQNDGDLEKARAYIMGIIDEELGRKMRTITMGSYNV